jgi:hypothetical protein
MCGDRVYVEGPYGDCDCGEMGSWTDKGRGDYCLGVSRSFRANMEGDKRQGRLCFDAV